MKNSTKSADIRGSYWEEYQGKFVRTPRFQRPHGISSRSASKAVNHDKRVKKKGIEPVASVGEVAAWLEANRPCAYCGAESGGLDHIQPLSRGGKHEMDNFQSLCRHCNTIKFAMTEDELLAQLEKIIPVLRAKLASRNV